MYSLILISLFVMPLNDGSTAPAIIVAIGAPGTPEYEEQFLDWSKRWQDATATAKAEFICIGDNAATDQTTETDLDQLKNSIERHAGNSASPLWLILIGHGTFDGQTAKFNLRGPDLSADELAAWLAPMKRPVVVINCASASAPFLNKLSAADRIVITATRSGNEQNFTRFGDFLSAAIVNPDADIDKDDQVSLLEAYLKACRQVAEFYDHQSRLATEHALLDDNGDGLGTPAEWFRGVRAIQGAKDGGAVDGARAHQMHLVASAREADMPPEIRDRRNQLELELAKLRAEKSTLAEEEHFARLERLLVELAKLYERAIAAKSD